MLVELVFEDVENLFLVFVDFVPEGLTLVEGEVVDLRLALVDDILVLFGGCGQVGAHVVDFGAELVVGQVLESRTDGVDFIYNGLNFLEVALRLVAENLA